jgi:uncharacterized protein (TIGR01777 family)
MNDKRIILAGGSGYLGRSLDRTLRAAGYQPVVLTRRPAGAADLAWDGRTLGPWVAALEGAAAVVNLAGRTVNCRHTPENKEEILASRVDSVRVLGEALRSLAAAPPVWIQAGSLAIFGDRGQEICAEGAAAGEGFAVEVCRRWEEAFAAADVPGVRKVLLRISFVLGRDGGALPVLARLARKGLGGRIGSGRQYVSWLHEEDLDRIVLWALQTERASGVYNTTGPHPVTNAELMRTLRAVLRRPWSPPVPAWAVRVGARFMRTDPSLVLSGRRGVPGRLLAEGFTFAHPQLEPALRGLFSRA